VLRFPDSFWLDREFFEARESVWGRSGRGFGSYAGTAPDQGEQRTGVMEEFLINLDDGFPDYALES
jgi:hypothetical protein